MKRSLSIVPVLILLAGPAIAQDKLPSFVGTWLVSGQAVAVGESLHPEHSNSDPTPKVHSVSLKFVFEKQEGNNFWGTSTGKSGTTERVLGAIAKDGKSGVLINARGGQQVFMLLDNNTVEGCYTVQDSKRVSAGCTIWTRQP
jgi:hypothetical protein